MIATKNVSTPMPAEAAAPIGNANTQNTLIKPMPIANITPNTPRGAGHMTMAGFVPDQNNTPSMGNIGTYNPQKVAAAMHPQKVGVGGLITPLQAQINETEYNNAWGNQPSMGWAANKPVMNVMKPPKGNIMKPIKTPINNTKLPVQNTAQQVQGAEQAVPQLTR